jgi:hypothetical protein
VFHRAQLRGAESVTRQYALRSIDKRSIRTINKNYVDSPDNRADSNDGDEPSLYEVLHLNYSLAA